MSRNYVPTLSKLGSGYNVKGRVGRHESIKASLFDFESSDDIKTISDISTNGSQYDCPSTVSAIRAIDNDSYSVTGSSKESYCQEWSVRAKVSGSYGSYSGEFESSYSSMERTTRETYYTTLVDHRHRYVLQLPSERSERRALMLQHVKDRIDGLEVEGETWTDTQLFDTYGTHFVARFAVGGQFRYSAASESTSSQSQTDFEASVSADYKDLTKSASFDASGGVQTDSSSSSSSSYEYLDVIGGTGATTFDEWVQSIDVGEDYLDMADFDDDSLEGLWELASDSQRRSQLQEAAERYLEGDVTLSVLAGIVPHGGEIQPPEGTTTNDWDVIYGLAKVGAEYEGGDDESESNNAMTRADLSIVRQNDFAWSVNATYRARTSKGSKNDVYDYSDGELQYLLVSKELGAEVERHHGGVMVLSKFYLGSGSEPKDSLVPGVAVTTPVAFGMPDDSKDDNDNDALVAFSTDIRDDPNIPLQIMPSYTYVRDNENDGTKTYILDECLSAFLPATRATAINVTSGSTIRLSDIDPGGGSVFEDWDVVALMSNVDGRNSGSNSKKCGMIWLKCEVIPDSVGGKWTVNMSQRFVHKRGEESQVETVEDSRNQGIFLAVRRF